jgi:hypothetical protein|tara:strand:+ start:192 stop:479 length:288 start_codon:yes stop_codon:yes gene_type:complete
MKEEEFLIELQMLLVEIDNLVDRYEMRDRVLSIFVAGLLEPIDENTSNMKAMYNYIVDSREELDTMLDFINTSYEESKNTNDLDDLLGGLDISLN